MLGLFDGHSFFTWIGSIALGAIFWTTLGLLVARALKKGRNRAEKKLQHDQETYGAEEAELIKKRQERKYKLILAVIIVIAVCIVWSWCR